jgi:hypothetical protein
MDLKSIKREMATIISQEKQAFEVLRATNDGLLQEMANLRRELTLNAKLSAEEIAQLEQRIFDLQSRLSDANKQSENRMEARLAVLNQQQQQKLDDLVTLFKENHQVVPDLTSIMEDQKLEKLRESEAYRDLTEQMRSQLESKIQDLARSQEELKVASDMKWEAQQMTNEIVKQQFAEFSSTITAEVKAQFPWLVGIKSEHIERLMSAGFVGSELDDQEILAGLQELTEKLHESNTRLIALEQEQLKKSKAQKPMNLNSAVFKERLKREPSLRDYVEIEEALKKSPVLYDEAQIIRKYLNSHFLVAVATQSGKIALSEGKAAAAISYSSILADQLLFGSFVTGVGSKIASYAGEASRKERYGNLYKLIPDGDIAKVDELSELIARKIVLSDQAMILNKHEKGPEKGYVYGVKESYVESLMKKVLEVLKQGTAKPEDCKVKGVLDNLLFVRSLVAVVFTNTMVKFYEYDITQLSADNVPRTLEGKVAHLEAMVNDVIAENLELRDQMVAKDRELKEQMAAKDQAFQELREQMAAMQASLNQLLLK